MYIGIRIRFYNLFSLFYLFVSFTAKAQWRKGLFVVFHFFSLCLCAYVFNIFLCVFVVKLWWITKAPSGRWPDGVMAGTGNRLLPRRGH